MRRKIEQLLFLLLFVLLPTQLGRHYWFIWSKINGIYVDLLSPTFYLTDLLILVLIVFNLRPLIIQVIKYKSNYLILLIPLVNIFFSVNPEITTYKWIELLKYIALATLLVFRSDIVKKYLPISLVIGISYTCLLALLQWLSHSSIGGIIYWFGERTFNLNSPGIAKFSIGDSGLYLRPYATFPHPNVLSGFIFISYLIISAQKSAQTISQKALRYLLPLVVLIVLLCVSRVVALFICLWSADRIMSRVIKNRLQIYLILAGVTITMGYLLINIGTKQSYQDRTLLIYKSVDILINRPFGVGLGGYLNYSYAGSDFNDRLLTTPVHNIVLLLLSEFGLLPSMAMVFLLLRALKRQKTAVIEIFHKLPREYITAILFIIFTGMFDHYWITINQTLLLLTVLVSLFIIEFDHLLRSGNILRNDAR